MKIKALLSVLAAGAVVTTAGVSYALWDQTTAVSDAVTLNVAAATVVSIDTQNLTWSGDLAPADSVKGGAASADFKVNVTNVDELKTTKGIKLTASEIKLGDQDASSDTKITIAFKEGATPLDAGLDTAIEATNNYTVEVTLAADADPANYAGKAVSFKINAAAADKA